nr:ferrochelatase-2, chloroplastic-like [Tanacetum cinerariifolium]
MAMRRRSNFQLATIGESPHGILVRLRQTPFVLSRVWTHPISGTESHAHVEEEKVGVLLLNIGVPETLNDVQLFLYNLFADPAHALKIALEAKEVPANVYVAMRYCYPLTEESV